MLRDLTIKMADCSETSSFEDNVMSVKYVHLTKKEINNVEDGAMDENIQVAAEQVRNR